MAWIAAMKRAGIGRVLCLLDQSELDRYEPPLLPLLERELGPVRHLPMPDRSPPSGGSLWRGVRWLDAAERDRSRVVVHCAAGIGRTGVMLAAWLVWRHRLSIGQAVREIETSEGVHRDPFEAGVEPVYRTLSAFNDLVQLRETTGVGERSGSGRPASSLFVHRVLGPGH